MKPSDERSLLRWYPVEWRRRYGPEMLAMIEDGLQGRQPPLRLRIELGGAGIRERLRQGGFVGRDRSAAERCRAGQALVLIGWAALVVAGGLFAKTTEHWRVHVSVAGRATVDGAFLALEIGAVVGAAAVGVGVVSAVPALMRALAGGGWRSMRGPVTLAGLLTSLTAAATVGLGAWAHHLDPAQRNGGSAPYTGAFLGWGVLLVVTIASWTRAGIRTERALQPTPRLIRVEWVASALTGAAILAVTAALIAWWVAVALRSPWILHGTASGSHASWWAPNLGLASLTALIGCTAALAGVGRLASAARDGLWRSSDSV